MATQCPICGAPLDGKECGYCGYKNPSWQEEKTDARGEPYAYARHPEQDHFREDRRREEERRFEEDRRREEERRFAEDRRYEEERRFEEDRRYAQENLYRNAVPYSRPFSHYSKWTAFVLCLLLGLLGVHRFYVRKIGTGLLWFFTLGFFGLGWLVDVIMILAGVFTDRSGLALRD